MLCLQKGTGRHQEDSQSINVCISNFDARRNVFGAFYDTAMLRMFYIVKLFNTFIVVNR